MAPMPWDTDRALDSETVREIVRSQFPEIDADSVQHLGEGYDFDAYEVDRRWVFRFPKRRDYDSHWLKEVAMLDHIAPLLPLPIPAYRFRGMPSDSFPYHFGGYEKLPGRQAMGASLSASALKRVAAQLGKFINSLHRFDPDTAAELAVHPPHEAHTLREHRQWALKDPKPIEGNIPQALYERCLSFLDDSSLVPAEYQGTPRLIHGDLLAEHILVDPAPGRVTGIIDWSDATAGDPANDFVGLWVWQGRGFVTDAIKKYEHPLDEPVWERMRYKAVCVAVGDVSYGHLKGGPAYIAHGMRCLRTEFPDA